MPVRSALTVLRSALPAGQTLPVEAWERRHRWMIVSLWVQMVGIGAYSALRGYGIDHTLGHALPMLAATMLACSSRLSRRVRSASAALGMFTAAAIAVHTSGGATEAHFYFFVVIVVLSLYEDWLPFLLAIGFVVLHHGVLGTLDTTGVYAPGTPGSADPWGTALIHGAFVAAAGAASVVAWRLNEDVRLAAQRSQEQFHRSFADAPIGMALTSASGCWVAVNRALCSILGREEAELVGKRFGDFTHPDDSEISRRALHELLSGERNDLSFEKRYLHSSGKTVWASLHVSRLNDRGESEAQFIVQMQDVTGRKHAEREAAVRSAQQQDLLTLGRVALSAGKLDELLSETVRIVAASLQVSAVRIVEFGHEPDEEPQLAADMTGPTGGGHVVSLTEAERSATASGDVTVLDDEIAAVISDQGSRTFGILTVGRPEDAFGSQDAGFVQAVAHVLSGAVQRLRSEDDLRHQSLHDPLVGLPNRVLFLDRVERALARTRRSAQCAAVIFIDLDRFKLINDSLGHDTGDLLLQTLVPRLLGALRENDTLARFGGDEFVVLCEDLGDSAQALHVAQRLRDAFDAPYRLGEQEHVISASIGVAVSSDKYLGHPEELIRDADAAMYRAKAAGRNRIELFDEVLRARIVHRLETEAGLRLAIDRGELTLHYQPIVDLATREVTRCEALVRWEHPERGLVPPDEFIPVAEETGLILPLGAWVIDQACRQMAEWAAGPSPLLAQMSVSVNLSALQVVQETLAPMIGATLRRHGVSPARLVCEITETALIHNPEAAEHTLLSLEALGVRVALDDFGTGYSSLASLKRFSLDAIKLDRSFIRDMTPGSRDAAIIGSLVTMADSLGLGVVAEGVETPAQCDQLRGMGCQVAQGFLFGRPVTAAAFADQLEELQQAS